MSNKQQVKVQVTRVLTHGHVGVRIPTVWPISMLQQSDGHSAYQMS